MISSFIRRAAGVVSILTFGIVATETQAQTIEWRGTAYLHSFTNACAVNGWSGTPLMNVRFRPPNLGTNGTSSRLSFFDRYYAFGFYLHEAQFNRNWRSVRAGSVGSAPWEWTSDPAIRVTNQTPRTIGANTPVVRLVGQIRNFDDVPNCTVSFDATMLRRR